MMKPLTFLWINEEEKKPFVSALQHQLNSILVQSTLVVMERDGCGLGKYVVISSRLNGTGPY